MENTRFKGAIDAAEELNRTVFSFQPIRPEKPILLTSIPKCGTMLIRNILAHFVGGHNVYWDILTPDTFDMARAASLSEPPKTFFWGHLHAFERTLTFAKDFNVACLIRDPRSYVQSYSRYLFHADNAGDFADFVRRNNIPLELAASYIIVGVKLGKQIFPSIKEEYFLTGIGWFDTASVIFRYEEVVRHINSIDTVEAKNYFHNILRLLGIEPPVDWKDRVLAGARREASFTFLKGGAYESSKGLSKFHLDLLEFTAPGLLTILGYK